ncbi:MAG: nuclear transport factor 2 family protein [Candidatus Eremiobacteraeota bacterium]|nr:nuclear transport factor 2 family protein [Candidatus Eremiobacteraeota bacterium]
MKLRASADVMATKWLGHDIALVDSVAETPKGRGWFTEIWHKSDGKSYVVAASRTRVGTAAASYEALDKTSAHTLHDAKGATKNSGDEAALRANFKTFRAAFNSGDSKTLVNLFTESTDAIVAFSFLEGRAQILNGRMAVGKKADRMAFGTEVSNPAPAAAAHGGGGAAKGAAFVSGEPKVIRFLSSTVAVVDGTAAITNIPVAHGFAPREMKGVYTDVWVKTGGNWQIEGARPWF